MSQISATAWYRPTSWWQLCDTYLNGSATLNLDGSATLVSVAVRCMYRRQCYVCIGGSVTFISVAVQRLSQSSATLSRRQCDVYFGGSATFISEAVWCMYRRQCGVCISGSVTFISVAVQRLSQSSATLSRRQCDVYFGGSATFISAAVSHLSRRQCDAYIDGSVIHTYVWGTGICMFNPFKYAMLWQ